MNAQAEPSVASFHDRLRMALANCDMTPYPTLPRSEALARASASLPSLPSDALLSSPEYLTPIGIEGTTHHLLEDILPGLSGQSLSSRYYGFVTGSVHPAATDADALVSALDQNVQVHLPDASIATELEVVTLDMLADLLGLHYRVDGEGSGEKLRRFAGKTFTTGATASNVLGLACGRESIIARRLPTDSPSVAELGLLEACARAGVRRVQVLTSAGHSSMSKAASIVGIGRANVREMPASEDEPWLLDLQGVETELRQGWENGMATIIAISAGEVNTGRYAVEAWKNLERLTALAKEYGSWIHVDSAFGIFAAVLETGGQFDKVREKALNMADYVDSITVDGHKLLNVPYDCGMFYTRSADILPQVFQNPNAAYLSSSAAAAIPSPLNLGIENSRRFRALPAYAVLRAEGRDGISAMIARMVLVAREIAKFVRDSEYYEWLPDEEADIEDTFMIVLFRAKDENLNEKLVSEINGTRDMYVSGTSWKGARAVRIAVASWRVDVERDVRVVKDILTAVAQGRPYSSTA